jgi:hypothetical protein
MTFDHWKTTEPDPHEFELPPDACDNCAGSGTIISGYERRPCPECDGTGRVEEESEPADDRLDRAFTNLSETALTLKADHDRFEAALRRIEAWKKLPPWQPEGILTDYEQGANDAIDMLAQIAREALDSAAEPKF